MAATGGQKLLKLKLYGVQFTPVVVFSTTSKTPNASGCKRRSSSTV